jgi:hypothetical protein
VDATNDYIIQSIWDHLDAPEATRKGLSGQLEASFEELHKACHQFANAAAILSEKYLAPSEGRSWLSGTWSRSKP